ncbi:MAG: DUF5615 family PIN-like protein [Dehalococcoidia bacterium]
MRFYLDEDLSQTIAVIARERYGLDVAASHEIGKDRTTDDEQLAFAAELGRCIVNGAGARCLVRPRGTRS